MRKLLLLLALLPGLAQAQARERLREPRGFDFTPNGVWRMKAQRVRAAREAAMRSGGAAALSAAAAVTGTLHMPVMLVQFKNTNAAALRAPAEYADALGSPAPTVWPYSLRTFYEEMSRGDFSVQPQVFGWLAVDSNDTWYEGSSNGLGPGSHVGQLVGQAVALQDAATDFGQFDNDGIDGVPNSGDDDGFVDIIAIVHPELGGECGGNTNIWAHRFSVSGWGLPVVTTNDLRPNGQPVRINNYIIQGAVGGSVPAPCNQGQIMAPGTIAHELGHGLGLPDLYDTNPNDGDDSEAIGWWGLMGAGNYARPHSPAYMEGFSRMALGWVTVRDVVSSGVIRLGPYAAGDTVIRIRPTGANPRGEYYLLENRQGVFADSALVNRTGAGLLVWHVDSTQYNLGRFFNSVNSGPIHGLALEQADGNGNLRSSAQGVANRGDDGDPFPGSAFRARFAFSTAPSLRLNTGSFPGFIIDSVVQMAPGGTVSFEVLFGALTTIRSSDPSVPVRVRGIAYPQFQDLLTGREAFPISVDSAITTGDGRRQLAFVSWSDGLPRSHHVTGSPAGGEIVATFARKFRFDFAVSGGGTVGTPSAPSGTFVAEGDSVVLNAAAEQGSVFLGWIGDTSTTNPQLVLRATRPWAVTAVSLSPASVVDQLLGGSSAVSPANAQHLDRLGNNNARLDVGDLLAWLDRSGTTLSPSVMTRLLSKGTR